MDMKKICVVLALAGLCTLAQAEEVLLQKTVVDESLFPVLSTGVGGGMSVILNSTGPNPEMVQKSPEPKGRVWYGVVFCPGIPHPIGAMADSLDKAAVTPAQLYLDLNDNKDLTDDPPLGTNGPGKPIEARDYVWNGAKTRILIRNLSDENGVNMPVYVIYPAECWKGSVKVGNRAAEVLVLNTSPAPSSPARMLVFCDADLDGTLDVGVTGKPTGGVSSLGEPLAIGGRFYTTGVNAGGTPFIKPSDTPTGKIVVDYPALPDGQTLCGFITLSPRGHPPLRVGAYGEAASFTIPAGRYDQVMIGLSRAKGDKLLAMYLLQHDGALTLKKDQKHVVAFTPDQLKLTPLVQQKNRRFLINTKLSSGPYTLTGSSAQESRATPQITLRRADGTRDIILEAKQGFG